MSDNKEQKSQSGKWWKDLKFWVQCFVAPTIALIIVATYSWYINRDLEDRLSLRIGDIEQSISNLSQKQVVRGDKNLTTGVQGSNNRVTQISKDLLELSVRIDKIEQTMTKLSQKKTILGNKNLTAGVQGSSNRITQISKGGKDIREDPEELAFFSSKIIDAKRMSMAARAFCNGKKTQAEFEVFFKSFLQWRQETAKEIEKRVSKKAALLFIADPPPNTFALGNCGPPTVSNKMSDKISNVYHGILHYAKRLQAILSELD